MSFVGPTGPTGPAGPSIPGPTGPAGPIGNPESVTWNIRYLIGANGPTITSNSLTPFYNNGLLASLGNQWRDENNAVIATPSAYFVLTQTSSPAVYEYNLKYLLAAVGPLVGPMSFIFYNNADSVADPTTAGWSQIVQATAAINNTGRPFTYNYVMLTANGNFTVPLSVMESPNVSDRTISVSCLSYGWDSNYIARNTFNLGGSFNFDGSATLIAIRKI